MSLYKDASLVMIPSAYKDGKLYSIRPTDGSGDFTFSRGSNLAATRVDVNGLIEKGRENVIVYSQDFSNANWSTNQSATISHGITDPNGGSTASRITFAANVNSGIYQQNPTLFASNNIRTSSLYMKGSVGGEVVMFGDATNRTSVTLTTSWVRYEGFGIDASTYFIIYTNTSSPSADTIDIAFVQYENGLVATDYIETGTSAAQSGILEDMPRLDYSGSCPSLLLEPQRTNLVTQSEYFAHSSWLLGSTAGAITIDLTDEINPTGFKNAYKINYPSVSSGQFSLVNFPFTSSATNYSGSFYFKGSVGGETIYISYTKDGVNYNRTICDLTTNWKRFDLSALLTAGADNFQFGIDTRDSQQLPQLAQSIFVFGAQLEAGSYPTSYIPTYGTSTTRGVEYYVKESASALIGQTEGVLFVDFVLNTDAAISKWVAFLGGGSEYIGVYVLGGTNKIRLETYDNGVTSGFNSTSAMVKGQRYKCAIAYANNDFAAYINGVKLGTDSSGSVPATNKITSAYNTTNVEGLKTNQLLLFKTRLTNAELAALTTL